MRTITLHRLWLACLCLLLLPGCQADPIAGMPPSSTPTVFIVTTAGSTSTSTPTDVSSPPTLPASQTPLPPPPPTPLPTSTMTATPEATSTPLPTATATPVKSCEQRTPGDDLLAIVTHTYGLSRDYTPPDLVPLSDYLPVEVTLGYPNEARELIIAPLVQMIGDMQAAGLHPMIISAYRSYVAQAIARRKWQEQYPEHVSIISAMPGHSEHQLGTTLDFGSPELPDLVGDENIEFHTYFYQTSEGRWLAENAHRYGFTLSYTREAFELTGFYYEPWHYRYVGVELATKLWKSGLTLTEYQLASQPEPCIP